MPPLLFFPGRCFWKIDDGCGRNKEEMAKGNRSICELCLGWGQGTREKKKKCDAMQMLSAYCWLVCCRHGHIFSLPGLWICQKCVCLMPIMPINHLYLHPSFRPAACCCSWWREREICGMRQNVDGRWMQWYGRPLCTQTD